MVIPLQNGAMEEQRQFVQTAMSQNRKTYTAEFKKATVQPEKVTLAKKSIQMGLKEKVSLKAKVLPLAASQKVTWKSSKKSVVSVSTKGVLTAKRTGKAVITAAASNGKTAKCTVTVKRRPEKSS